MFGLFKSKSDYNELLDKYNELKAERDALFNKVLEKDAKCGAYLSLISNFVNIKLPPNMWTGNYVVKMQNDMIKQLKEINGVK